MKINKFRLKRKAREEYITIYKTLSLVHKVWCWKVQITFLRRYDKIHRRLRGWDMSDVSGATFVIVTNESKIISCVKKALLCHKNIFIIWKISCWKVVCWIQGKMSIEDDTDTRLSKEAVMDKQKKLITK